MQNAAVVIQGEPLLRTVGELVRKARKTKGLTQAELGTLAGGKNKETINRLEAGENTRVQTLVDVATALGTTADAILSSARATQSIARIGEETSPVSPSGIKGANRPRVNTAATDVGGLDGRAEGPPPDYPRAPIPPDEELVERMREHADFLRYAANRFTQHTKLLWSLLAAYDAGGIRSDRAPRPPTARGPASPDRRPVSRPGPSKRTG